MWLLPLLGQRLEGNKTLVVAILGLVTLSAPL
jgi:hypothetical protein